MNSDPIVKEVAANAPVYKVWEAVTDNKEMKKWYFDLPDFKPETGLEFQFYGGTEEHQYLHLCKITDVIPERKISYTWRYDGYPGLSTVTFELFPEGEKTRVKLTHKGVETFPAANPDFAKGNFVEGWEQIMNSLSKLF